MQRSSDRRFLSMCRLMRANKSGSLLKRLTELMRCVSRYEGGAVAAEMPRHLPGTRPCQTNSFGFTAWIRHHSTNPAAEFVARFLTNTLTLYSQIIDKCLEFSAVQMQKTLIVV